MVQWYIIWTHSVVFCAWVRRWGNWTRRKGMTSTWRLKRKLYIKTVTTTIPCTAAVGRNCFISLPTRRGVWGTRVIRKRTIIHVCTIHCINVYMCIRRTVVKCSRSERLVFNYFSIPCPVVHYFRRLRWYSTQYNIISAVLKPRGALGPWESNLRAHRPHPK